MKHFDPSASSGQVCRPPEVGRRQHWEKNNMIKKTAIKKIQPTTQITIYETEDGKARVEVRFENENVWLTQKLMAELFDCTADNISLHLKNIFKDKELDETSVTEEYSATASDDKSYKTRHYS